MTIKSPITTLLQVKIDPVLKGDLEELAHYKGISMSSLVKLILKEESRRGKKQMLTENGLREEDEFEILRREKEALETFSEGKTKAKSGRALLRELNA